MDKPKETVTLPAIRKKVPQVNPSTKSNEANQLTFIQVQSTKDVIVRHSVKRLSSCFKTWHTWQQRVFVCHVMEHCSKHHLEFLATALEPILHLDFSSSLVPHMQSLHLDGVATFQIHRNVMQSMINPSVLEAENSMAYLNSIPTTLLTSSSEVESVAARTHQEGGAVELPAVGTISERESLLPALPLTHIKHAAVATSLSTSKQLSLEDAISVHRQRFSSVPDFRSTTDLLKHVKHKESFKPAKRRDHRRSRSVGAYPTVSISGGNKLGQTSGRLAEHFKGQLAVVSDWMGEWHGPQKASLLLEMVKLCDKELLGYLVQCLYQRLQDGVNMESLPNALLLHILSYLDPQSLGRCSQVCRRWLQLCSLPELWRAHCRELGRREEVGDLASAVETMKLATGGGNVKGEREKVGKGGVVIDWKRAYRDLSRVTARIKALVVKAAMAAAEREEMEHQRRSASLLSSAALRANLSLREMIQLVRSRTPGGRASTHEVVRSAPESAAAMRRRIRTERREALESREKAERERAESSRYQHRRPHDRLTSSFPAGSALDSTTIPTGAVEGGISGTGERVPTIIELIHVAIDMRPSVPYLPDPDGVQCLILAGCLPSDQTPRPGRVQPIPRLRRLKFDSSVLSLQCDQRKIVSGTADREIHIHDIRSGRHVHTLLGHKGSVQCLQFDDYKIVSGSWDTTCIVWDVVHFSAVKLLTGHTDCVSCLQFDDQKLVTGSYDKSVRVWSTSSWECIVVIGSAHKGHVTCLRFSESVIATGSEDRCVKVWSLPQYLCTNTLEHGAAVVALQLSALLLVSACRDGTVCLWNLHSPQSSLMQWTMEDGVYFSVLSIGGSRVFGAGSDSVVYEWDIATGTCARTLTGHSKAITAVWVGEHKIVTAAEDHTVCVWYSKITLLKGEEVDELDPNFVDIPIRVITQ